MDIIVCGMLGDWWADLVPSSNPSPRFQIEQALSNGAYIQYLADILFILGYCVSTTLKLVTKSEGPNDKRIDKSVVRKNLRLTTFTFHSLAWVYYDFYLTDKEVCYLYRTNFFVEEIRIPR